MRNFLPNSVARIIFGLTMAFFGFGHLTGAKDMAAKMLNGWPMAEILVYVTGICLILAAISFIFNKMVKLAGYLLALLLIIIVIGVHAPGLGNVDTKVMATIGVVKDLGIAMGAIAFANASEN